jgi:hypothetical protein
VRNLSLSDLDYDRFSSGRGANRVAIERTHFVVVLWLACPGATPPVAGAVVVVVVVLLELDVDVEVEVELELVVLGVLVLGVE